MNDSSNPAIRPRPLRKWQPPIREKSVFLMRHGAIQKGGDVKRFIGRTVNEAAEHFQKKYSAILLAVVTETSAMRLDDILSSDATAIDNFIRRKFEESGKDFFSSDKGGTSIQINPPRDYVLTKQDAAIVLGRARPSESSILEKSLDLVTGGRAEA